ncbi:TetR/AcrR family transcriptional regulator [Proteiniclasticum sp. C24MP]|uniref:TetR/AcrR family transcriptional regulator n=1 Tax=Proteiniclasticum sp. C24MP TaxID=3374101 RepID=UPI003753E9F3
MHNTEKYTQKQILIFEGVMTLLREGRQIHELKVADIAESCGMGKSTAYEYFSSKEEIIREALGYHLKQSFMQLTEFVFKETTFKGMARNALDYLEKSLEERFTGIFLMLLTEKHEKMKSGSYMDENMQMKMESIVLYQIERAMIRGKEEGQIGEEMTLEDVRMTTFGFFTAYVHELVQLKMTECRVQRPELTESQAREEIAVLKDRTLKLLLKTLH